MRFLSFLIKSCEKIVTGFSPRAFVEKSCDDFITGFWNPVFEKSCDDFITGFWNPVTNAPTAGVDDGRAKTDDWREQFSFT